MRFLTDVSPPPHIHNNAVLIGLKALYSLYTTPFLLCSSCSAAPALHTPLTRQEVKRCLFVSRNFVHLKRFLIRMFSIITKILERLVKMAVHKDQSLDMIFRLFTSFLLLNLMTLIKRILKLN